MGTKTVTMRLPQELYEKIARLAEADNRPFSNYLETIAMRHVEREGLVDDDEMKGILADKDLMARLKKAHQSAAKRRGRFV